MISGFLSYRYDDVGNDVAEKLRGILSEADIFCRDGKEVESNTDKGSLNEQIESIIKECDILVALFIDDHESPYIAMEAMHAKTLGKPIILATMGEVNSRSLGLFSHYYRIRLDDPWSAFKNLLNTVNQVKTQLSFLNTPTFSHLADENEIDKEGWPDYVRKELKKIRAEVANLKFSSAIELSNTLLSEYDDCWRAEMAISGCLVHLRRYDEASDHYDHVSSKYHNNPVALSYCNNNKAWLLGEREPTNNSKKYIQEKIKLYKNSIDLHPRPIPYFNLIYNCLLIEDVEKAEQAMIGFLDNFPDQLAMLRKQARLQGAEFVHAVSKSKWLTALLLPKGDKDD